MKIGLLTIHNAINYGAILQTYATSNILSNFGDVEIIDYENKHFAKVYSLFRTDISIRLPLRLLKDIVLFKSNYFRRKKFDEFSKKYFKLSNKITDNNINLPFYDFYVCGSDQIWNPTCTNGNKKINGLYFLDFAPNNSKKISYASSLGNYKFNIEEQKIVKRYLNNFKHVSVREKDGKEHLKSFIDVEVEQVLDPTLLLSKEEWINNLNLKKNKTKNYILVYSVPRTKLIKDAIKYYAKELDLDVIAIDKNLSVGTKIDKQIRDASPIDFLNLFLNASFIITDSFHGVCFSVNFEKQFVAISSGKYSNRMRNFLSLINLEDRIAENINDFERKKIENINYIKVNKILEDEKKKSLEFLMRALNNE